MDPCTERGFVPGVTPEGILVHQSVLATNVDYPWVATVVTPAGPVTVQVFEDGTTNVFRRDGVHTHPPLWVGR